MIRIECRWVVEPEASGYVVTSPDVPGLVAGGETLDEVDRKVRMYLPAMLERPVSQEEWCYSVLREDG